MSEPKFRGIIPPMVTPLDEQRSPDMGGVAKLAEHMIQGGVHGLFAIGTTGEGPSLSMSDRQRVVAAVCDQVAGRLPVMVGITDTIFSGSVEIAEMSYAAGAAAVVVAPPYYLPMTQPELLDYLRRLADACSLPVMLYNMPGCCKTWIEDETVAALAEHENIVGLKDSSGDLDYFKRVVALMQSRPDFSFFVGPEEILVEAIRHGCHGGVHGGANMFPQLYVSMYETAAAGRWSEADAFQQRVQSVSSELYGVGEGPSRIIKGIKTVCQELGLCSSNQLAEPFEGHTESEQAEIKRRLTDFNDLRTRAGERVE